MTTLLAFVLALGILICFHELGHYFVARLCNVKILKFSFGFGPKLLSFKAGRDQTEWIISALPIGGYVAMLGEKENGEPLDEKDAHRAFHKQSVWRRFAIVAAGPIANLLLAVILYAAVGMLGQPQLKTVFWDPVQGSQAQSVGIERYDQALTLGGDDVQEYETFTWQIIDRVGQNNVPLVLKSPSGEKTVYLDLRDVRIEDEQTGVTEQLGFKMHLGDVVIKEIVKDSAAQEAGLQANDKIIAINGEHVHLVPQLIDRLKKHGAEPSVLTIERELRAPFDVTVVPHWQTQTDEAGGQKQVPVLGVMLSFNPNVSMQYMGPVQALGFGVERIGLITSTTVKAFWRMATGQASTKGLSGPVTIAEYAGKSAQMGLTVFLSFLAMISVSLGILNLLPIPVLDGGHLLYYCVEIVRGRPLPRHWMEKGYKVGLFIVIAIFVVAMTNDFLRLLA